MAKASMYEEMVDVVGRRIVGGGIGPREVMSLAALQEEFGVSRTVAREAMRALEALGLITARRRVGLIVSPAGDWDVLDPQVIRWNLAGPGRDAQLRALMDLRIAVEPVATRLAAQHATPAQREHLLDLVGRLSAIGEAGRGDSEEYLVVDVEFHVTLLRASANPLLVALEPAVTEVLTGRSHLGLTPAHPDPQALACHVRAARAVAGGDAAQAEEASRTMLALVRDELD
ncbi:FadR/GntR family transcriptional regulator [Auraticoccus monumenti]|uniref:DNA-binding transcriptional regulator, FadR family n=1 Tax=Auraticoccus monumenti TaxID=675864 RepID=A0A1G7E007_9ACTN|nr:FCD domain-containing protein [Auraticoccus monumenti]SDE56665.1 DNA-binding transcriptional regulator, FadR family [Auraticoccus monumenti]